VDLSQHREEYIDLCAGYVLGSLEEVDRQRLERHLAEGCRECEEAIADFAESTVLLAASASSAQPNPALRQRVLSIVSGSANESRSTVGDRRGRVVEMRPRRQTRWITWGWAAAAALLAITSLVLWNQSARLKKELDGNRHQVAELESRLGEARELNAILSAPAAKVAVFGLTPEGEQALRARATYDPATQAAVVVFDHFKPPSGHDYELWAIRGGRPASLGLIKVDESGHAVMRIANAGDPATLGAFAVSLELEGGSPDKNAPSGPVVMLGRLGG
jgi:anti-sigma-K factor RskA